MQMSLVKTLEQELTQLGRQAIGQLSRPETARLAEDEGACRKFAIRTAGIVERLVQTPHIPARVLARETAMDRNEIKLAYKLIQTSSTLTERLRASPNGDYLSIVNHYFNTRMYVIVFFVGLSCPSRCIFCPNVTVQKDGSRTLRGYQENKHSVLCPESIIRVFEDISQMKKDGTFTLIKISGGLEPLTDPETMSLILKQTQSRGIKVKLFTNGLLLNTPERRRLALAADDVRISVSFLSDEDFGKISFGPDETRKKTFGLTALLDNLRNLVRERDQSGLRTRIGINTIVLEENHKDIEDFVELAQKIGADYIDFKPNYFSPYLPETQTRIAQSVSRLKQEPAEGRPDLYFAGSLSDENLFWTHRLGRCSPHKQGRFKLFITPFGRCSPVHHGAFPSLEGTFDERYTAGRIGPSLSLADILHQMPDLPDLEYEKLNPFEHMLALEIDRGEKDRDWEIPREYDPYNFPAAKSLPPDLAQNPVLNRIFPNRP